MSTSNIGLLYHTRSQLSRFFVMLTNQISDWMLDIGLHNPQHVLLSFFVVVIIMLHYFVFLVLV